MSLRHHNVAGKLSFVGCIRLGKPKEKPLPNRLRKCLPRKYLSGKFQNQLEMNGTPKTDLLNELESHLLLYCNHHKFQTDFWIGIPDCLQTLKKTCKARRFSDVSWLVCNSYMLNFKFKSWFPNIIFFFSVACRGPILRKSKYIWSR